jgi:hypothetical protein
MSRVLLQPVARHVHCRARRHIAGAHRVSGKALNQLVRFGLRLAAKDEQRAHARFHNARDTAIRKARHADDWR